MPEYRARVCWPALALCLLHGSGAALAASPAIAPGDASLRHDIQLLADAGILRGPVTTWPLAWGPILADLARAETRGGWHDAASQALARVARRAARETRTGELDYRAAVSAAERPLRWRAFAATPRESGAIEAGVSWIGDRLSVELNGAYAASPDDGREWRADGSMLAAVIGNYAIAASTLPRWWGPGWDGSLILSSNARPMPAVTLDRQFTDPFASRWLSWLGPWDLSAIAGWMESDRFVPDARFFGVRFNFRPLPALEIGLSRTAQWCGEGRPCGFDTFTDLLLGRDNRGDGGIDPANEPGNQLAGVDFRWGLATRAGSAGLYGQFIGEDEAGGFPSRYLGQLGLEFSGSFRRHWSFRAFAEVAETSCGFYASDDVYNCAYNHSIYRSGYRYRGRVVGHGADNDARVLSAGLLLVDDAGSEWRLSARYGDLNRGGVPDTRNTLTPVPEDLLSADLAHAREFGFGLIEIGAGVERRERPATGRVDTDLRAFLQWRSAR